MDRIQGTLTLPRRPGTLTATRPCIGSRFGNSAGAANKRPLHCACLVTLSLGGALGFFASATVRVGSYGAHSKETLAGLKSRSAARPAVLNSDGLCRSVYVRTDHR
jgi:hypothetical protein